jgi:hypothetical protein
MSKKETKVSTSKHEDPELENPKGTLALTLMFMVTIVILWSWVYQTLLSRGMTP